MFRPVNPFSTTGNFINREHECAICHGGAREVQLCKNGHSFCRPCIDAWLSGDLGGGVARAPGKPDSTLLIARTCPGSDSTGALDATHKGLQPMSVHVDAVSRASRDIRSRVVGFRRSYTTATLLEVLEYGDYGRERAIAGIKRIIGEVQSSCRRLVDTVRSLAIGGTPGGGLDQAAVDGVLFVFAPDNRRGAGEEATTAVDECFQATLHNVVSMVFRSDRIDANQNELGRLVDAMRERNECRRVAETKRRVDELDALLDQLLTDADDVSFAVSMVGVRRVGGKLADVKEKIAEIVERQTTTASADLRGPPFGVYSCGCCPVCGRLGPFLASVD